MYLMKLNIYFFLFKNYLVFPTSPLFFLLFLYIVIDLLLKYETIIYAIIKFIIR